MKAKNLDDLERALDESGRWIAEVEKYVPSGGAALRAVLPAVRDCLPFAAAVELGNDLPALIRGTYYDGWDPTRNPVSKLSREEILERAAERFGELPCVKPDQAFNGVLRAVRVLLEDKMPALMRDWPPALQELAASELAAAAIDKKNVELRAASERAALDGAPGPDLAKVTPKLPSPEPNAFFEKDAQDLDVWIHRLMEETGWTDPQQAFIVLRGVLEALRDRMPRYEAFRLGEGLPCALRGFYFEDWTAEPRPSTERPIEQFRSDVAERLAGVFDIDPDAAAGAVFRLLARGGDLNVQAPQPIRALWPAPTPEAKPEAPRRSRIRKLDARTRGIASFLPRRKFQRRPR